MATAQSGECPLCGRSLKLAFHHLIPKKLHRRTRFRKTYAKAELSQAIWICRLCHDGLHDHYDERTLAKYFPTLESIQIDSKIQRHAEWLAKQKVKS
ncbi:MAG: hypothetical protein F6K00_12115 [Leptolyngbya sp. SIOISBB]|nr:hypothetical protein [Leptolyngbya sp. SIOISBB]